MRKELVSALKSKYRADYNIAHANLNIYLTNPVGIGEHPQHFDEMDKLVDAMTAARDKLEILDNEYPDAVLMTE